MAITVNVKAEYSLNDLSNLRYFGDLLDARLYLINTFRDGEHSWDILDCNGRKIGQRYKINVLFIGQTGYGKSSTINTITNTRLMETDSTVSCTREMNCINYEIGENLFLSFCDMPGIGENDTHDSVYKQWYADMFLKCDCVVYILRADQKNLAIDIAEVSYLRNLDYNKQIVLALNQVDRVDPVHDTPRGGLFELSDLQERNLIDKIKYVSAAFNIPRWNIVAYSSKKKYGIRNLCGVIGCKILSSL